MRYRHETGAEQSIVDQRLLTSCFVVEIVNLMIMPFSEPESEAYGGICPL